MVDCTLNGCPDFIEGIYTPTVRNYYYNFALTPNNIANNVGILTVNATNVVSIEKIDNCYAPKFNELSNFFETEDSYEVYLVGIDMKVNINTEYFYNGINYKLVVLVNNNGVWQVGGQYGAPIEVLLKSNGMFVDEAITSYSIRVLDGGLKLHNIEIVSEQIFNMVMLPMLMEQQLKNQLKRLVTLFQSIRW